MIQGSECRMDVRAPIIIGLISILVLVCGLFFWGLTARIAGGVMAPGQIEIEQNRQIVQHRTGGVVTSILVKDGASVPKGETLLQLDSTAVRSELAIVDAQLFETLVTMARLRAVYGQSDLLVFPAKLHKRAQAQPDAQEVMAGQYGLWQANAAARGLALAAFSKQKSQLLARISGHDAQTAALSEQLALLQLDLADQQALFDKGLVAATSIRKLMGEKARLAGALGNLDATRTRLREGVLELNLMMQRHDADAIERALSGFRDLRSQERVLRAQMSALRVKIADQTVRAPVAGIVYGLRIQTPFAVVRSAEPLMYIIPQDRPLLIAAQVAPSYIGQVSVGQMVGVRVSAHGQQTAPELQGVVRQISADALEDPATGNRYFRVEITLSPNQISTLGKAASFQLGMSVTAFIKLKERPPIVYLLEPIGAYFKRAFRES